MNDPKEHSTTVTEIIQRTYNVISVRAQKPEGFDYQSGQCVKLTISSQNGEVSRFLSFSSSSTEPFIEFTKKISRSDFSKAFSCLKAGDPITYRGPAGCLVYEEEFPKVAFIAGGIGITPIRSIIRHTADKEIFTDRVLLYANRTEEDIAFREELDQVAKKDPTFRIRHILENPTVNWGGTSGLLSVKVIEDMIPDILKRKIYICGSPPFVSCVQADLKALGVTEDQIVIEELAGYESLL
ncbi:MAG: ferredoxin--NADP reductase [bacterium]